MRRRFLLLSAPLSLAGCGSLLPAQKYIPRTSWPLQPQPPSYTPARANGPVLLVRAISPAPGLEQRGLQCLTQSGSLKTDYYNLWAVPPAEALTQGLINWAQASGHFSAVITPGSRLTPDLIIEGELSELLVDLATNQARAQMTLLIIKPALNVAGFAQPLMQAQLTATALVQGSTPGAQAAAQSEAVANLLTQVVVLLDRFSP